MDNYRDYTLPQLKQLQTRIAKEIGRRALASKAGLLKKLEKLAQEQGMTLTEVLNGAAPTKATKGTKAAPIISAKRVSAAKGKKVAVKYRHPSDKTLTWTGRGSKPLWVQAYLANGGALDALETAAQKMTPRPSEPDAVAPAA